MEEILSFILDKQYSPTVKLNERAMRIELTSRAWEARVITIIRRPQSSTTKHLYEVQNLQKETVPYATIVRFF